MQTLAFLSSELQAAKHRFDEALAESSEPLVGRNRDSPDDPGTDFLSAIRRSVKSTVPPCQVVCRASSVNRQ